MKTCKVIISILLFKPYSPLGLGALYYCQYIALSHYQQISAFYLDLSSCIFAVKNCISCLYRYRFIFLARACSKHDATGWFFFCSIRNDDTTGSFFFSGSRFYDHPVMQRSNV